MKSINRTLWRIWLTEWLPVIIFSFFIGLAITYWLVSAGHVAANSPWVFFPSAAIPSGIFVFTYPRREKQQ